MLETLSGRLSATFNLDGLHLDRYLQRKNQLVSWLFEDLILHDRVLIPTQDYLTACGIALILGERNFISLLEEKRIGFIRTSGVFGYVRGTSRDGSLAVFNRNGDTSPQDSPIDKSVNLGLEVIARELKDKNRLASLLIENSVESSLSDLVNKVRRDSYNDLRQTALWKTGYNFPHRDRLALPKIEKMQVRVIGPGHDPLTNPVDLLLALTLYNIELVLAAQLGCVSHSTAAPLGDSIELKAGRLMGQDTMPDNLWMLLEINRIPDFSNIDTSNREEVGAFIKCLSTRKTSAFRSWFHNRQGLSEREFIAEYLDVVNQVPYIQKFSMKAIRFAITTALDFVPVVGKIASFLDSFVVERVLRGNSPKFFIEDLKSFKGLIKRVPSEEPRSDCGGFR